MIPNLPEAGLATAVGAVVAGAVQRGRRVVPVVAHQDRRRRPPVPRAGVTVGVTAGASAPEILVQEVLDGLCALGASAPVEVAGRPENITFSLPRELRIAAKNI